MKWQKNKIKNKTKNVFEETMAQIQRKTLSAYPRVSMNSKQDKYRLE